MSLTRKARAKAEAAAERAIGAQKAAYKARIERIQGAFSPPLSNAELSAGLELPAPAAGSFGGSALGRFVSEAPRNRRARPDSATRALIDALLAGELLIAARPGPPGARREVLVLEAGDLALLPRWWEVRDLSGRPVPARASEDWDADDVWDLFGDGPRKPEPPPPAPGIAGTVEVVGRPVPRIGLGTMRLSTAGRPEREVALTVLRAALDGGVRLLDTADTYGLDDDDLQHSHRLIREALAGWDGPREGVVVATKVGLARPGGRWVPAGEPEQLVAAAEASREALGVESLDLLQLHVPSKDGFPAQVEALAGMRERGVARAVGLCNVSLEQLEVALGLVEVASVQVALHRGTRAAFTSGLLERCHRDGIPVLAHSPLGGFRGIEAVRKEPGLVAVAEAHGASPEEVGLAWLLGMAPGLVALPGATRVESVRSAWRAQGLAPSDAERAKLEAKRPWAATARQAVREALPPEIVLVAGPPAAGKTSRVAPFVGRGYERLNRDLLGGDLKGVDRALARRLEEGGRRFVLDNTYPSKASRAGVLAAAKRHGVPVRLVWLEVEAKDAYVNACLRMIERRGRLLTADEIRAASKEDPNLFPPAAIHAWFQRREEPSLEEGFARIERVGFERRWGPEHTGRALILDYDGTLRRSTGGAPFPRTPDEVEVLPGRVEALQRYVDEGWTLLGVSNQSGVARGDLTREQAVACFERTNELLGQEIDVRFDTHDAGTIDNWTRKPMPGLGVELILEYGLDPARCLYVGDRESDREFAENCGFGFAWEGEFFGPSVKDGEGGKAAPSVRDGEGGKAAVQAAGRREEG